MALSAASMSDCRSGRSRARRPDDLLFMLGSRGAALAVERGRQVAWTRPMATRLDGVAGRASIGLPANSMPASRGARFPAWTVMFGRYRQGARRAAIDATPALAARHRCLAASAPRQAPLHNLAPRALFEKLDGRIRVRALDRGRRRIDRQRERRALRRHGSRRTTMSPRSSAQLRQAARQARQSEITSELLDLITGAEAIGKRQRERHTRMRPKTTSATNVARAPSKDAVLRRTP